MKKPWSIKAKADKSIEILLYEQIGADFWSGDGTTAKAFAEDLKAAGDITQIYLRINSPGGDVFDGLAIYNTLLAHPAHVTAQVDGLAASISSVIPMAADEIIMGDNTLMMIHNPWSMVMGDSNVMRKMADTMDTVRGSMVKAYQRHSSLSDEKIAAMMDEETWMSASEALDNGFATKVEKYEAIAACITPELAAKFKHMPAGVNKASAMAVIPPRILEVPPVQISAKVEKKMENTVVAPAAVEVDNYNEVAAEIFKIGRLWDIEDAAVTAAVKSKASLEKAKSIFGELVFARERDKVAELSVTSGMAQPTISALTQNQRESYSVFRAIRYLAGEPGVKATLEQSVSEGLAAAVGQQPRPNALYIPTKLGLQAALDTKTGGAGGFTVDTTLGDLIDILRNRMMVRTLGATVLSGLSGNVTFPVLLSGCATSWVGQNPGTDVTDVDATFGSKTMTPKTLQGSTAFSRQFLAQTTTDAEGLVRNELAIRHALAIDLAAINGSGLSNQPLGLLKTSGIGSVAVGTNGGAPTYALVVDLEASLANANADTAAMKFLTTPTMRAKLRKTEQFATTNGMPVWQQLGNSLGVGDVLGYPGYVSNQVPSALTKGSSTDCHAIIFGDWSQIIIGEWGVIELVVDPYRLKKQGLIEVTSFQMVDILVRQPASMTAIQDSRNV